MRTRNPLLLAIMLALGAPALIAQTPELPELPQLNIRDLLPEVREQVQQAYETARSYPKDAGATGRLGMILDIYERYESAVVCYKRAHWLAPDSFRWLYYLGSLQARKGRREETVATLRVALRLNPDYLPAQLKLAESLLQAGEVKESGEIYQAIVKRHPDCAEARYGLGRILSVRGNLKAAAESYEQACELFPPYGAAHYALGLAYRKLRETKKSQQHMGLYAENKNLVPPVEDPLRDALRELDLGAVSHLNRGVALEQAGRLEDAIAEHEKALQLDPKLVTAHVNLIALYGRLGNYEKAEEHYRTAVALNPDQFAKSYYFHGVLLLSEGKYPEAEQELRRALEINPFYAEAHNNLAYLLERRGEVSEAVTEYRKALESKPDYRQAHFNLGRILVNQKQFREGIQHLSQTLTPVDESTPTYLYALGASYARAGDRENALRYLHEARDQASARGQSRLLASIEKDLSTLEGQKNPR